MKEKLKFILIDTSKENSTEVVLYKNGELFSLENSDNRGHIKNLVPLIKEILEVNALNLKDLDFISIIEGPGSWTGLRIGFSTVKVLCLVNKLKLILVNNFDLYLENFENKTNSKEIAILINSSNINYYYRYVLVGTSEFSDGISSEEILNNKFPHIEKIYFTKPSNEILINFVIKKFEKSEFSDINSAEPYYISTGDLKSNFIKARL